MSILNQRGRPANFMGFAAQGHAECRSKNFAPTQEHEISELGNGSKKYMRKSTENEKGEYGNR
jgi:hypothetical protein